MQASNNHNHNIQRHVITSPALKSLLQKDSNIQSSSVADHLQIIQSRKRQELNDYLMVCTQRLSSVIDPTEGLHDIHHGQHNFVHSIIKRTCKSWCS